MRRIVLVSLLGIIVVALSAGSAYGKPKPKPPMYKTGTYKAKVGAGPTAQSPFNITLKRASCASAPGQAKSSLHLCVALPVSPTVGCTVPLNLEVPVGSFVAPVQLPTSGKVTEQAPVTPFAVVPGSPPTTGQSTFAVSFTKKGTASGYIEITMKVAATPTESFPCSTGKVPFTAKLG